MEETWVQFLGREDPLEEKKGNPLHCSCLENLMDRGVWQAIVHGVTKSQAQLNGFIFFLFKKEMNKVSFKKV